MIVLKNRKHGYKTPIKLASGHMTCLGYKACIFLVLGKLVATPSLVLSKILEEYVRCNVRWAMMCESCKIIQIRVPVLWAYGAFIISMKGSDVMIFFGNL